MTFFSLSSMHQEETETLAPDTLVIQRSKKEKLKKEKELLGIYLTEHPMDAVKDILPRLSVVSLGEFDHLPHGAVVRTLFMIDKVTTRLSSKGQKNLLYYALVMVLILMNCLYGQKCMQNNRNY